MNGNVVFGQRVQRLRVARQLGQRAFAERIGLDAQSGAVSKIEKGRRQVDEELTATIAAALDVSVAYLRKPAHDVLVTDPWLRAYADASKKVVDAVVADNELAQEAIDTLELQRMPDRLPTFDGDRSDAEAIESFAQEMRTVAGLDEGEVVGHAIRAAEKMGCLVLPMAHELGRRHMGLSQRLDGFPVIRVSRSSASAECGVPGDRQRFTTLHEVGHLALHANCPPPESSQMAAAYEREAHRFASAFLAPADPLLDDLADLGRITLTTLSELKATWGIAIKALVVRLRQLGVVDDDHARSLYKQISSRGWNKKEPVPVSAESAIWFDRALTKRFGKAPESVGVQVAAEAAEIGRAFFERWIDWTPTEMEPEGSVIQFPGDRSRRRSHSTDGGDGVVRQLPRS